jgi:hypothetical protein
MEIEDSKSIEIKNIKVKKEKLSESDRIIKYNELIDLCNKFYEKIPLNGYGNQLLPLIDNKNEVKSKMKILSLFNDLKISSRIFLGFYLY